VTNNTKSGKDTLAKFDKSLQKFLESCGNIKGYPSCPNIFVKEVSVKPPAKDTLAKESARSLRSRENKLVASSKYIILLVIVSLTQLLLFSRYFKKNNKGKK